MPVPIYHTELLNLIRVQGSRLDKFYAKQARKLASILKRYKLTDTRDVWKGNKGIEKEVNKVLNEMDAEFKAYITKAMKEGVDLNNRHTDDLVKSYVKGMALNTAVELGLYYRNNTVVQAWLRRRANGIGESKRVWQTGKQTKEQLEFFLKEGLSEGRSAAKLTGDLKQYLKEPDRRYRRVRDKNGKLVLSNPAKNYSPGRGVYRSSYKNALRLARNEINIAYRYNDHERVQNLDFVLGIKVNLSPSHPRYDICDELQGNYPKQFQFVGWHPQCLCYTTTLLMTREQFITKMNTGKEQGSPIKSIPKRAEKYLNEKSKSIKGYKNKPYFIQDNFKNTKEGFALKKNAQP